MKLPALSIKLEFDDYPEPAELLEGRKLKAKKRRTETERHVGSEARKRVRMVERRIEKLKCYLYDCQQWQNELTREIAERVNDPSRGWE